MSEAKGQQEPSMEEILASIRRIIAEDGESAPAPAPRPAAEQPPAASPQEDILDLTELVAEDGTVVSLTPGMRRAPTAEPASPAPEIAEPPPPFAPAADEELATVEEPVIDEPAVAEEPPPAEEEPEPDTRADTLAAAFAATVARRVDPSEITQPAPPPEAPPPPMPPPVMKAPPAPEPPPPRPTPIAPPPQAPDEPRPMVGDRLVSSATAAASVAALLATRRSRPERAGRHGAARRVRAHARKPGARVAEADAARLARRQSVAAGRAPSAGRNPAHGARRTRPLSESPAAPNGERAASPANRLTTESSAMLDKNYHPAAFEPVIYAAWETAGAFAAHPDAPAQPYSIMMPPPNVTGSLHMGHALTFTLQDILIRYHRMTRPRRAVAAGHRPCRHRHADGGRAPARGRAIEPPRARPRRLHRARVEVEGANPAAPSPASCARSAPRPIGRASASPWTRACRPRCARCSSQLHREGLIYRDKRLVNWDPKLHTAISDLEVESRETKGSLWYFRYPIEGEPGDIHHRRDDAARDHARRHRRRGASRRRALQASHRQARRAAAGRPAHSDRRRRARRSRDRQRRGQDHAGARFQRFRGRPAARAAADQIFDRDAHLNDDGAASTIAASTASRRARQIVADLEALGPRREDRAAHADGAAWRPLGRRHRAVADRPVVLRRRDAGEGRDRGGRDRPHRVRAEEWENTFFDWMRNIQPWCISRQIWWGHQIPAWYGPDGAIFVEETESGGARRRRRSITASDAR